MTSLRLVACVTLFSLCAPGVSLACLAPPFEHYLLWPSRPVQLQPSEVVIEVGPAAPTSEPAPANGKGLRLSSGLWIFDVAKVLAGKFEGKKVAVDRIVDSCSRTAAVEGSNILVGRLETGSSGTTVFRPREMPYEAPEHLAALQARSKRP